MMRLCSNRRWNIREFWERDNGTGTKFISHVSTFQGQDRERVATGGMGLLGHCASLLNCSQNQFQSIINDNFYPV